MRITVKEGERERVFRIPTRWLLNKFCLRHIRIGKSKEGIQIPPSAIRELRRTVRRIKERHPDWVLVEVDSPDAERVEIKL